MREDDVSVPGGNTQKFILENCGHVPHREFEGKVLDKVEEFFLEF